MKGRRKRVDRKDVRNGGGDGASRDRCGVIGCDRKTRGKKKKKDTISESKPEIKRGCFIKLGDETSVASRDKEIEKAFLRTCAR